MSIKNRNNLSEKRDWEKIWDENTAMLTFEPKKPFFQDIHKLLKRHLPQDQSLRCLEVGCYPGTYMWYFNKYFGYRMSGLEYVESCAEKCGANMHKLGIDADICHADLFSFRPDDLWDIVFSVGFIEHFVDTDEVVKKHLDLVKPGGYLVLIIPNHSGMNGKILKRIDGKKHAIHNCMDYDQMRTSVENAKCAEIIEGGYYGHAGFWNTDIYPWLHKKGRIAYFAGRVILYGIEHLSKYLLPETAFFSPNCALVARKVKRTANE